MKITVQIEICIFAIDNMYDYALCMTMFQQHAYVLTFAAPAAPAVSHDVSLFTFSVIVTSPQ